MSMRAHAHWRHTSSSSLKIVDWLFIDTVILSEEAISTISPSGDVYVALFDLDQVEA